MKKLVVLLLVVLFVATLTLSATAELRLTHFAGVQKYVDRIGPRYSQMLGNWLHGRMTKK